MNMDIHFSIWKKNGDVRTTQWSKLTEKSMILSVRNCFPPFPAKNKPKGNNQWFAGKLEQPAQTSKATIIIIFYLYYNNKQKEQVELKNTLCGSKYEGIIASTSQESKIREQKNKWKHDGEVWVLFSIFICTF